MHPLDTRNWANVCTAEASVSGGRVGALSSLRDTLGVWSEYGTHWKFEVIAGQSIIISKQEQNRAILIGRARLYD